MKAKKILYALALPLALAACSEELGQTEGNNFLGDRTPVGVVSFVNDVNTRAVDPTTGENNKFLKGEQFGLALMDDYNPGGNGFYAKYTLTNKAYTSYAYTKSGNEASDPWVNTNASLLEGNYFSFMPYGTGLVSADRTGFSWKINQDQFAYDANGALTKYQALADNQFFLGYAQVTTAAPSTLPMNLQPVHATPNITIRNRDTQEDVKVESFSLYKIDKTQNPGVFCQAGYLDLASNLTFNKDFHDFNNGVVGASNPISNAVIKGNAGAGVIFTLNFKEITLPKNKAQTIENVYMVVPSIDNAFVQSGAPIIKAKVTTPKGYVDFSLVAGYYELNNNKDGYTYQASEDANTVMRVRLAQTSGAVGNNASFASMKALDGTQIYVEFSEKAILIPNDITVTSTAELTAYLKMHELKGTTAANINITLDGDDIALTDVAYGYVLNRGASFNVTFKGDMLTIPQNVGAENIINKFTWSNDGIVIEGTQKIGTAVSYASLTILNKGTLDIDAASTFGDIFNVGTLNVNTVLTANVYNGVNKATGITAADVLGGTLNINANIGTGKSVYNYGTTNIASAASIPTLENHSVGAKAGVINVNADLTISTRYREAAAAGSTEATSLIIAAGKTMKITATNSGDNNHLCLRGIVTINGVLESLNTATEIHPGAEVTVTTAVGAKMIIYGENDLGAKITNNGRFEIATGKAFTNSGYIINGKELVCQQAGGSTFTNAKDILVKEGAILTYITSNGTVSYANNAVNPEIIIEKRNTDLRISNATNYGYITYTAKDADFDTDNKFTGVASDKFNKLKVTGRTTADLTGVNATTTLYLVIAGAAGTTSNITFATTFVGGGSGTSNRYTYQPTQSFVELATTGGDSAIVNLLGKVQTQRLAVGASTRVPTGDNGLYVRLGESSQTTNVNINNVSELIIGGAFKSVIAKPVGKFLGETNNYTWSWNYVETGTNPTTRQFVY